LVVAVVIVVEPGIDGSRFAIGLGLALDEFAVEGIRFGEVLVLEGVHLGQGTFAVLLLLFLADLSHPLDPVLVGGSPKGASLLRRSVRGHRGVSAAAVVAAVVAAVAAIDLVVVAVVVAVRKVNHPLGVAGRVSGRVRHVAIGIGIVLDEGIAKVVDHAAPHHVHVVPVHGKEGSSLSPGAVQGNVLDVQGLAVGVVVQVFDAVLLGLLVILEDLDALGDGGVPPVEPVEEEEDHHDATKDDVVLLFFAETFRPDDLLVGIGRLGRIPVLAAVDGIDPSLHLVLEGMRRGCRGAGVFVVVVGVWKDVLEGGLLPPISRRPEVRPFLYVPEGGSVPPIVSGVWNVLEGGGLPPISRRPGVRPSLRVPEGDGGLPPIVPPGVQVVLEGGGPSPVVSSLTTTTTTTTRKSPAFPRSRSGRGRSSVWSPW